MFKCAIDSKQTVLDNCRVGHIKETKMADLIKRQGVGWRHVNAGNSFGRPTGGLKTQI